MNSLSDFKNVYYFGHNKLSYFGYKVFSINNWAICVAMVVLQAAAVAAARVGGGEEEQQQFSPPKCYELKYKQIVSVIFKILLFDHRNELR